MDTSKDTSRLDVLRFRELCREAMLQRHEQGLDGIGTLAEKRMHAILKKYVCPNENYHEIPVDGTRYVSDVRVGNSAYEIQTGLFAPMKKKIGYYLEETDLTVTVVHPIVAKKWVAWVDPLTRSVSERVPSPKHEKEADLLPLLYPLIPYLESPRLCFRLLVIEAMDFRILSKGEKARKKRSSKYERIPLSLLREVSFSSLDDYRRFLPDALPSPFKVSDFAKATGYRGVDAYSAVRVLVALGVIRETEKIGRAMAFERMEQSKIE
ncbi:MAG: hypothetical protein E7643_09055 [Ruminococcaceae bacterium]|nr:hypothetical protein [Oscillospiraceae bacterium]